MHPQFTTIYLVGRDQVLTIDSGADEERYRWMLRDKPPSAWLEGRVVDWGASPLAVDIG